MANCLYFAVSLLLVGFTYGIPGGWSDANKDDPNVKKTLRTLADHALLTKVDGDHRSFVGEIIQARTQVVAGSKWEIIFKREVTECPPETPNEQRPNCYVKWVDICNVTIWIRPWLNSREVTDQQCERQQQNYAGGITEEDVDDVMVQKSANWASTEINKATNSMYHSVLVRVESVTKQVVAGMLYRMKILLGETTCRKQGEQDTVSAERCPPVEGAKGHRCTANILVKEWLETTDPTRARQLLKFNCEDVESVSLNQRSKRSIYPGVHSMDQGQMIGEDDHDVHITMFLDFKARFNKVYENEQEESKRFEIFRQNMMKVRKIQAMERGSARYGATQFADLTSAEFRKNYLSPVWKKDLTLQEAEIPDIEAPTSFDWRPKGAVTEVKNQGSCGSCWAFSTTGNIEGQWFLKKKQLVSLSEQELVDCDKVDEGCNGGLPSQAYKEIMRIGGLEGESDYKYEGRNDKCRFSEKLVKVYINSSVSISSDETKMAVWLAQNGPISIGINANTMQFYFGGIAHPWKIFCNPKNLDHGVLIVGYGVKGTEPYWIIKNSWGPSWGEQGYYLVYRGDGTCGLNTMCTSAVVN